MNFTHEDERQQKQRTFYPDDQRITSKINKVCCIKIPDRWSMKTQIIVVIVILFLVVLSLGLIISSVKIAETIYILQTSQNQLYIHQANKSMLVIARRFRRLIKVHFDTVQKDADNFQKVYLNVEKFPQNLSIDLQFLDTPYLLTNKSAFINSTYDNFSFSWICYSAFGAGNYSDNVDNQTFINSIKHFNQIFPLIQNQNTTYLAIRSYTIFYSNEQIFCRSPCNSLQPSYQPNQRPWYLQMVQIDGEYRNENKIYMSPQVSQPYLANANNLIQISYSKILHDKDYHFMGVSSSSIEIQKFQEVFSLFFSDYLTILANYDGNLLISPYFNEQLFDASLSIFFNDTNITGFDQQDWDEIKRFANQSQTSHNCSQKYLIYANILCRWNKIEQRNVLIYSTYLKRFDYYIIILLDEVQFMKQLQIQMNTSSSELIIEYTTQIFAFLGCFILIFLIILLILNKLFKPLNNITTYSLQIINKHNIKQSEKKKRRVLIEEIVTDGVFHLLTYRFYQLVQKFASSMWQRNQQCGKIEMVEYPRFDHSKLKVQDQLAKIHDFNQESDLLKVNDISTHPYDISSYLFLEKSYKLQDNQYNQRIIEDYYKLQVKQIQASIQETGQVDQELIRSLISQINKQF